MIDYSLIVYNMLSVVVSQTCFAINSLKCFFTCFTFMQNFILEILTFFLFMIIALWIWKKSQTVKKGCQSYLKIMTAEHELWYQKNVVKYEACNNLNLIDWFQEIDLFYFKWCKMDNKTESTHLLQTLSCREFVVNMC